jgi:hypothetical protein
MKRVILLLAVVLTVVMVAVPQPPAGGIGYFPPPNNGTTGFTYQPSSNTYHFTRTDGTFSNVLVFDNSLTPGFPNTNDFSADSVNTDGQRDMITYHYNSATSSYQKSSLLNLDQDGHFALGSSSGGGIGSDPSSGDTCIPVNILANGPCNVPSSLHINSQGKFSQYQGLPLDGGGNGMSTIVKAVNGTASGSVNNYLAWTTPATGYGATEFYEVSWVGVVTSPAPGTTAAVTWNFIDESGPNSCSSPLAVFGSVGNRLELTCRFYSSPNTPVSVSVLTMGGSPTYGSHLRVIIH